MTSISRSRVTVIAMVTIVAISMMVAGSVARAREAVCDCQDARDRFAAAAAAAQDAVDAFNAAAAARSAAQATVDQLSERIETLAAQIRVLLTQNDEITVQMASREVIVAEYHNLERVITNSTDKVIEHLDEYLDVKEFADALNDFRIGMDEVAALQRLGEYPAALLQFLSAYRLLRRVITFYGDLIKEVAWAYTIVAVLAYQAAGLHALNNLRRLQPEYERAEAELLDLREDRAAVTRQIEPLADQQYQARQDLVRAQAVLDAATLRYNETLDAAGVALEAEAAARDALDACEAELDPDGCSGPPEGGGPAGVTVGDPHLVTFDRLAYDFQAEGEFVLARSTVDSFEVQVRQYLLTGSGIPGRVALTDRAAVRVSDHVVEFTSTDVLLDGVVVGSAPIAIPGGGRLTDRKVVTADGTVVRTVNHGWYMDVRVELSPGRAATMTGLLGNADGTTVADLMPATGGPAVDPVTVGSESGFLDLYERFGRSWIPGPQARMFTEPARAFAGPARPMSATDLAPTAVAAAFTTCQAAGWDASNGLAACVFDVAATGDQTFADIASQAPDNAAVEAAANAPNLARLQARANETDAKVSAGKTHTCAVYTDRTLWCWGNGAHGQLGVPPASVGMESTVPVQESSQSTTWDSVSAGVDSTCGVRTDRSLWCWGSNSNGKAGLGDLPGPDAPTQVGSDSWATVDTGTIFTCGVRTDNTLWCWGSNPHGQLGDGTTVGHTTPQRVGEEQSWVSVSAGDRHACAVRNDSTLWCWGGNANGELGIGTVSSSRLSPVQVGTFGWASVTTGEAHTCAVRVDTTLWCWGTDVFGQAGLGTGTSVVTPAQVDSAAWATVTAGGLHTCGRRTDNTLWCWGNNGNGQIGDGTTNFGRRFPTAVQTAAATWVNLAAGANHTCATQSDGTAWCWGSNLNGQLGDGTTVPRLIPARVS